MVIGIVVLILWSLCGALGILIMIIDSANKQITENHTNKMSKTKEIFIMVLSGPLMWIVMFIGYFANVTTKSKEV